MNGEKPLNGIESLKNSSPLQKEQTVFKITPEMIINKVMGRDSITSEIKKSLVTPAKAPVQNIEGLHRLVKEEPVS